VRARGYEQAGYVNNNNKQALRTLLAYNEEDVVNLRVLRQKLSVK
jgi:uncharacterized protein YprB with RNaseH-like and TPR domain